MKKLIFLFFLYPLSCYSQDITEKQQDVLITFVYVHNQQETLKYIKLHFPEQYIEADIVEDEFNKRYSVALSNINLKVRKIYGDSLGSYISQLNSNLHSYYKSNKMTKVESFAYLERVRKRAKGLIESPILEALTKYQQLNLDTLDLKNIYYVRSYLKGKKIDLSVELPKDWKQLDGQSPSVLKAFRSQRGNGNKIISIQRNDKPKGIVFLTKKMLSTSVPINCKMITSDKKLLNDEYIDVLEFEEVNPAENSNEKRITTRYFIIKEENIYIIDCSVYGKKHENIRPISQRLTPLYESIVQSIRFTDITKKDIIARIDKN